MSWAYPNVNQHFPSKSWSECPSVCPVLNLYFNITSLPPYLHQFSTIFGGNCITKGHSFKPISTPDILVFFSMIYYMGIFQLPAKTDYWKSDGMWPTHKAIGHISYNHFQVIWSNIYLVKPDGADNDGDNSDSSDEGEDMDDDDDSQPQDERWFAKAAPIIDLINETSKMVCKFPAFCVSIDEQMKNAKVTLDKHFK